MNLICPHVSELWCWALRPHVEAARLTEATSPRKRLRSTANSQACRQLPQRPLPGCGLRERRLTQLLHNPTLKMAPSHPAPEGAGRAWGRADLSATAMAHPSYRGASRGSAPAPRRPREPASRARGYRGRSTLRHNLSPLPAPRRLLGNGAPRRKDPQMNAPSALSGSAFSQEASAARSEAGRSSPAPNQAAALWPGRRGLAGAGVVPRFQGEGSAAGPCGEQAERSGAVRPGLARPGPPRLASPRLGDGGSGDSMSLALRSVWAGRFPPRPPFEPPGGLCWGEAAALRAPLCPRGG